MSFRTITLQSFETAYASRCSLSRLQEIVVQTVQKGTPNRDDALKIVRKVASDLNAVKFDDGLLKLIAVNVEKALSLFRQKVDAMIHHDHLFTISGSTPSTVQVQKLDAINCLYAISEGVWALLVDFEGTVIESTLISCTEV